MKCALHNSRASLHGQRYTAWTAEALPYKPSSKAVLTKSKVNVNKWRFLPCSRMKRFNILKIPILPRLCYKFSVISIKIQQRILDTWQSDDTKLCLANLNQIPYDYRVEVRNRFKGLDLIECPMNCGQNSWHCTGDRDQYREKKCKKAKWLSGEAVQIAVKRREVKSKGEKERYKHLNSEFQRIARRDKKACFSDQCKEIEENNRIWMDRYRQFTLFAVLLCSVKLSWTLN